MLCPPHGNVMFTQYNDVVIVEFFQYLSRREADKVYDEKSTRPRNTFFVMC